VGGPPENILKVNFGALDNMSNDLLRGVGRIDSTLSDLNSQATALMGTWDGDAKLAYQRHQAKWTEAADGLKEVLRNVKLAVDQSRLDFMDTESRNAATFSDGH
jgi:WXG100 family type VII secretion target